MRVFSEYVFVMEGMCYILRFELRTVHKILLHVVDPICLKHINVATVVPLTLVGRTMCAGETISVN